MRKFVVSVLVILLVTGITFAVNAADKSEKVQPQEEKKMENADKPQSPEQVVDANKEEPNNVKPEKKDPWQEKLDEYFKDIEEKYGRERIGWLQMDTEPKGMMLLKAVQQQTDEELGVVRDIAEQEGSAKVVEAIDRLRKERENRYEALVKEMREKGGQDRSKYRDRDRGERQHKTREEILKEREERREARRKMREQQQQEQTQDNQ